LETTDTLIIGAGPAGLTTAYSLTRTGHGVIVIEQDKHYVGGISRTVSYKGFLFDIGGHRFYSKSREVVALWDEILPDDFLLRPRLSRIYYAGKFYAYPLKAFEALRNLGPPRLLCLCPGVSRKRSLGLTPQGGASAKTLIAVAPA
jgi:protoporphyrinogen oxidase